MGGRQSQEPTSSPLSCHTTASSERSHTPPSSHLAPTLSEYPHLRPSSRSHNPGHSSGRLREDQPQTTSRHSPPTSAERLVELDIALTTLQQRLRARGEAHERVHNHHHHHHHRHSAHHSASTHSSTLSSGLPLLFFRPIATLQCPLCSKDVLSAEFEAHMAQCISRPRVTYNADTLTHHSGECSICLDDMLAGEEIARLPCLCIYHLKCTQEWFKVSQTCPEHPDLA